MKEKFKIWRVVLLCLLFLAIGCSKDSYNIQELQKDKSTIVSQRTITGTEALAIGQRLNSSLNSVLGKTTTNYGTIDYSEIKSVINTNGKENYTFRILNHPESSETVFFNLVMTQREGYTTVMLMKYEMDPAFAEAYYAQSKGFAKFGGTVTTSLISSNDPCPPVVVPPVVIPYGGDAPDTTPDQGSDGNGLPNIPLFTILDANDNNDGNSGTGTGTGTGTTTESTGTNGCHCAPQGSNFKIASNNGNDAENPCPKDNTAGILSPEAQQTYYQFWSNLPTPMINWLQSDTNHVMSYLFHYLYDNGFSDESKQFAIEMIEAGMNGTVISYAPFFKYPVGSNYATLYPEFTFLVKDHIPTLKNDQKLINTISKLTSLNTETIKKYLTWGNGPEINIVQLGNAPDGTAYKGKFNPSEPDKIFIDIDLVQYLENYLIQNGESQELANIRALIMFSVCLHELVHYADYDFDGLMQDNANLELGLLFESTYIGGYLEFDLNNHVILIKE